MYRARFLLLTLSSTVELIVEELLVFVFVFVFFLNLQGAPPRALGRKLGRQQCACGQPVLINNHLFAVQRRFLVAEDGEDDGLGATLVPSQPDLMHRCLCYCPGSSQTFPLPLT